MRYNRIQLHKYCKKYKIEHTEIRNENKIIFICPEIPDESIKIELVNIIPKEAEYHFIVGPKITTTETLLLMFGKLGIFPGDIIGVMESLQLRANNGNRHFLIELNNAQIADDHPFWNDIGELLAQDGFYKTWTVTIDEKTITEKTFTLAQEVVNNNKRDRDINGDDVQNLKISLYRKEEIDVLDFLKELEG